MENLKFVAICPDSSLFAGNLLQWNFIVTKAALFFTRWENYRTEEVRVILHCRQHLLVSRPLLNSKLISLLFAQQFESSYIRKLFLMDFLNYYTWFFLVGNMVVQDIEKRAFTSAYSSVCLAACLRLRHSSRWRLHYELSEYR